jgi:hypothetical protein
MRVSAVAAYSAPRDNLPGSTCPPFPAREFASQPQWDVQVAKVGVTPLAPTIRVGGRRGTLPHARSCLALAFLLAGPNPPVRG